MARLLLRRRKKKKVIKWHMKKERNRGGAYFYRKDRLPGSEMKISKERKSIRLILSEK